MALDSLTLQSQELVHRHGALRPKDVVFAKIHKAAGHKWFDSGEYFLSKEGKVPSDLIPGGARPETCPPRLSPDAKYAHARLPVVHEPQYAVAGGPSVSDY
ncbi:hypothetical protein FOA52_000376 [Chlamydomonas sp. UWO 241]|nr:hypothetical protein FOA52_000376 [Chlamydomonas sp. UWO 241]